MRPDLFDKKLNQDNIYNQEESENPFMGPVMVVAMVFILVSLFISNISYMKKNPNMSRIKGFKFLNIKNVPITFDIPQKVVDNTVRIDKLANVLYANKKVIYLAYPKSCPQTAGYLKSLENLISQNPDIKLKYYYYPDPQDSMTTVICQKPGVTDCIQNFLFQNCGNNACIVNSPKRQFKVISNTDAQAAYDAIVENLNW